jgi:hypothetical protein
MLQTPELDAPPTTPATPPSRLRRLLSEPLLHFILCAAVLLAIHRYFGKPEITVTPEIIAGLYQDFESRAGRPPTPAEREKLLNDHLDDEVLYREALAKGLEQDSRVRTLLIQTMRTTLRPVLSEPTDAELESLRREIPEAYRYPQKVSFAHVSFAVEKDIPPDLLDRLRAGHAHEGLGTLAKLPNPFPPSEPSQIDWMLGTEFREALVNCADATWCGPFKSRRGVHFVRIISRELPRDLPLADIRPKLGAIWIARKESAEVAAKAAELRQSYRIVLPANPAP